VFDDIDGKLERGVHTDSVKYREAVPRVELVPALVKGVEDISREWEVSILSDLRRHGINNPGAVFGQRKIAFLSVDQDEADRELANGIELEFELEAARQNLPLTTYTSSGSEKIRGTVTSISDKLALHREMAARSADAGEVPAFVVVFTIEHADGGDQISVRAIYPGREYRAVLPFGEKPATGPKPEDKPGVTRGD
jgi:hypothetical protein